MRIGELSLRTGATPRALRYYEEQGLLRPARRASGYREYADTDVRMVAGIRTLLAAGLGTSVIAEVLPCLAPDGTLRPPTCPELVDGLAAERARITGAIAELTAARDILDGIMAAGIDAPAK